MPAIILVSAAAVFCTGATAATAPADTSGFVVVEGDTLWLSPTLEVVGSRVPASLPGLVRHVAMLGEGDLERLPGRSAPELLQMVPSVVTGQRQQYGVQSDLTIRGSSFEQVQVLLDGYDLSDPQTGHHLMNLPLGRHDIARLEVLPGHGSALYGSGAFGGTVNVVPRRPLGRTAAELGALGGGNGTWSGWGSLDLGGERTALRASAEAFHTDGYTIVKDDGDELEGANEADIASGTVRLVHTSGHGEGDVYVGYADRDFGATGFYAPVASWEQTRTLFASARWNARVGDGMNLEPRLFFRRHTDHFVLFRDDPDRYINDHVTRKIAGEVRGIATVGENLDLAAGVEAVYEDIDSQGIRGGIGGPALGNHLRRRLSLSAELDRRGDHLGWQLGGRLDKQSNLDVQLSGTAAMSWLLEESWTFRASIGNVYRVPTFTDLYYEDPFSRGDPGLTPEKGWTWEVGVEQDLAPWRWRVTWFARHERDLIDWVLTDNGITWQAVNVAEGKVTGLESTLGWRPRRGHAGDLGWTLLEKETSLPGDLEARYVMLAPRNQLTAAGTVALPLALSATVTGRYLQRTGGPDDFRYAFVLDARLDWRHAAGWYATLTGTNLLDRRYMEVPGVPMPGTLFTLGAGRRF